MIDDPNTVRFDEIEIGNRFFDPATQMWFVKETEHTAGSSGGAHLEFAPGHLVSVATWIDIENNGVRLNEFDHNEWRDWILKWNPGVTAEQFDLVWDAFVALKAKKKEH